MLDASDPKQQQLYEDEDSLTESDFESDVESMIDGDATTDPTIMAQEMNDIAAQIQEEYYEYRSPNTKAAFEPIQKEFKVSHAFT
jgi:hypothetical protein